MSREDHKPPLSSGDKVIDAAIAEAVAQPLPTAPVELEDSDIPGVYRAGLKAGFYVEVTFDVAADTEVQVANPLEKEPEISFLSDPLVYAGVSPGTRLYLNNNQALPAGVWTKVAFDALSFDALFEAELASNRIVTATAGVKRVSSRVSIQDAATASGLIVSALYLNGSLHSYGQSIQRAVAVPAVVDFPGSDGLVVVDDVEASANDRLEIYVYQNYRAAGATIMAGDDTTYLSVMSNAQGVRIYRDEDTAWSADEVGFKCNVDTSTEPLTVLIYIE